MRDLCFDLSFAPVLTPFTAVCPIPGGFNVTRKNVGLDARGKIQAPGIEGIALQNAVGFLDHSHGLLERTTSWRWAIGAGVLDDGTPVGFNLIEGFNDNRENVIWLGSSLYKVPPATFDRTRRAWRITTADDMVDLTLNPEGSRDEDMNLGFVSSRYTQPLGTWSGRLMGNEVVGLVGVAEDHTAKW